MAVEADPNRQEAPSRPAVVGVSHVSVQVRDMERSLRFYRELLGMTVSIDRVVEVHGVLPETETARAAWHAQEVVFTQGRDEVHVHRRVVFLRWEDRPGATFVILSQHLNRDPIGKPAHLGEMGIDHVAFIVDDVKSLLARAAELREVVAYGPDEHAGEDFGHPGGGRVVTAMLCDPDGTMVQIDQWL